MLMVLLWWIHFQVFRQYLVTCLHIISTTKGMVAKRAKIMFQFSSVQSLSHVRLFASPWTAACQASLSITNSQSLLKLMSIELMMPSNHLVLCRPLLLLLQSSPASGSFPVSQFFASGGQRIDTSASASVLPMKCTGLNSFRMDWLDLLAVQGTLKSLLRHHSLKAPILRHSAFFMVPFTSIHDYWKKHNFD